MCGIAGFLDPSGDLAGPAMAAIATAMADRLRHRGPDDAGVWVDQQAGIALSHRRLAIVDLSTAGHQPMLSPCRRYVVSYNGEIYNHQDLRRDLEAGGTVFKGHADTETLVAACTAWGLPRTLQRLNGMYAFALWDRQERRLHLVRDRLGIKPLYWGRQQGRFFFASELKALHAHPEWSPSLDRTALASYIRFAYVPAPRCIYSGVQKLAPGTCLTINQDGTTDIDCYWNLRTIAREASAHPETLSAAEAVDAFGDLLTAAVRRQMLADVPVGAFLSGGVDSSTVVALMQQVSAAPVRSFSIGSTVDDFDEATHARRVAGHLGTEHTELYVAPDDALELIPKLPDVYDEPFADSSQLLTYLVSAMTRESVTVALSGDGGDEILAGYNRHVWAAGGYRRLARIPAGLRHAASGLLRAMPTTGLDRVTGWLPVPQFADKVQKFGGIVDIDDQAALYRRLVSQCDRPEHYLPGTEEPYGLAWDDSVATDFPDFPARMQFLDTATYLPDDILTKVDRASMAVSLEVRVPLLDHRVVEFAWRLPQSLKIRAGKGKWLLRKLLARHVPPALTERPKQGFALPLAAWLRGPLRDWGESMLSEQRLRDTGLLDIAAVRRLWQVHHSGLRNEQHGLWTLLMFQAWQERWG